MCRNVDASCKWYKIKAFSPSLDLKISKADSSISHYLVQNKLKHLITIPVDVFLWPNAHEFWSIKSYQVSNKFSMVHFFHFFSIKDWIWTILVTKLYFFYLLFGCPLANFRHCWKLILIHAMFTIVFVLIFTQKLPRAQQQGWITKLSWACSRIWYVNFPIYI